MADQDKKIYELGGRRFWVAPIVARQEKWLWPIFKSIFTKVDHQGVEMADLLFDHGARVCAILLIEEKQTQVQKIEAGQEAVNDLERWLAATCRSQDLAPVVQDFFTSGQLAVLAAGMVALVPASLTTGSTTPSAS